MPDGSVLQDDPVTNGWQDGRVGQQLRTVRGDDDGPAALDPHDPRRKASFIGVVGEESCDAIAPPEGRECADID